MAVNLLVKVSVFSGVVATLGCCRMRCPVSELDEIRNRGAHRAMLDLGLNVFFPYIILT